MKRFVFASLSFVSLMFAATGCAVPSDASDLSEEDVASQNSGLTQALSYAGKSDSCAMTASFKFTGTTLTGRQVYELDLTNSNDFGAQGCIIRASFNLARGFNLRIASIQFDGNEFYGPQSSGNVFTYYGIETTTFAQQMGVRTGGTAFATKGLTAAGSPTGCQNGFTPETLFIEPFVSMQSGTSGSAAINRMTILLDATPC